MSALTAAARRLAACWPPRRHRRARIERETRDVLGMPRRHPESLTRELPGPDEEWLAALCAALWPNDEYGVEL